MKKQPNRIGVWMDHNKALLIEYHPYSEQIQTLYADLSIGQREEGEGSDTAFFGERASSNEDRKENKYRDELKTYFKSLEKVLKGYDEILLFGPGKAKNELKNLMREDKEFQSAEIFMENAEAMTENQYKAYVRDYFRERDLQQS